MVNPMSGIDQLLTIARQYAAAEKIELSAVSWRVFGDSKKIGAIEAGADIQVRRQERAVQWFSDNWPDNAKWPKGIQRPASTVTAA